MFKNPNGGIGWPAGYSLRGGVDLGTISASGRKEGFNQGPLDYKSCEQTTGHACLTRHAVYLFSAIQCSEKYYMVRSFSGYAWNLTFAEAFNLLYLLYFNFWCVVYLSCFAKGSV